MPDQYRHHPNPWEDHSPVVTVDARREQRGRPPMRMAILTIAGRENVVRVLDLSRSGARIAYNGTVAPGTAATLQFLDQPAQAGQVRWCRDGRIGLNFTQMLE